MSSSDEHTPVLLNEVLSGLKPETCGRAIDATFGRGGHSRALLAALPASARLLVIDRDPAAVAVAQKLAESDSRVVVAAGEFSRLREFAADADLLPVDAILMDTGVSSPQIDEPERGFSFRFDAPLDMRMDTTQGMTAAQWLNTAEAGEMAKAFRELGDERFSGRIAAAIVAARPLQTTGQLVDVINAAQPKPDPHKHSATRVFQACRMVVNNEVSELAQGLQAAYDSLAPGGRLAVISFHSGDDRQVKRAFRALCRAAESPRRLPVRNAPPAPAKLIGRAVKAGDAETRANPRARSAVLRILERVA
ncbi:MAG: 16S rRNA (cytosine(1402)-N(4))-methyltransferase RsmH [Pseudomonadaceae bacterium]|nr:16S rRNA (cytosine(1402)-N(4))-methyltransferase RsmH [Pseudomonadaceae bacterium]